MIAVLYALLAAFSLGGYTIVVERGLRYSSPLSGILIMLIVETSVLMSLAGFTGGFFFQMESSIVFALVAFVLAGVLAPGLGNLLSYVSIERLGVVVSSPISASSPLFATLGAILVLGESPTVSIIAGTILISIGIALVYFGGLERSKGDSEGSREMFQKMWRLDIIFPLLGAFSFGFSDVVRKIGLDSFTSPILAAAIGSATSLIVFGIASIFTRMRQNVSHKGFTIFAFAGILHAIVMLSLYYAMSLGEVILVRPIISAWPLFTLLLAHLLFRNVERVTLGILCGVMLIILSVILITLV